MLRLWMVSPSKEAPYCFCCKLFSNRSNSKCDSEDGFSVWWKRNPRISEHEPSL